MCFLNKKYKGIKKTGHFLLTSKQSPIIFLSIMKSPILVLAIIFGLLNHISGQTSIITQGSVWKYLDNGSSPGTSWRSVTFNDATWKSGAAQLGYGDGDEATVVSYGTNAAKKYITTYFRKVVSISNPTSFRNFTLNLKRDDGAIVYVNGTERFRSNMPTGTVGNNTKASSAASDDGNTWQTTTLANSIFINGNNAVCVEIHQFSTSDPDISFDLQLLANSNLSPLANAGIDQAITLPANAVTLNGNGSSDPDGSITGYLWTQVSGPSPAVLSAVNSVSTTASSLTAGTYTFRLTVTDNNGATATDDIIITVSGTANISPTANAGSDQTIGLPANSVTLNGNGSSDPDGTINGYLWTQVSGPSVAVLSAVNSISTTASSLTAGTYTFRLTVTDNNGATATDDVVITVNAITTIYPVPFGSVWKYKDNGSNLGTAWRTDAVIDTNWASGPAQLGYGDGDEATTVSFGTDATNKYITTYFRKTVNILSPASYSNFTLSVKRDDGIVVYVNGTEVYRDNMPTGTIAYNTLASTAASDDGASIFSTTVPTSAFSNGSNIIAVEIHQNAGTSSDISFDMELKGNPPGLVNLTRGPYLQMGNETAATLRWRSDAATDSKIEVGTVLGNYTLSAINASQTTEHEVRISGLTANTKYYYRFGSSTQILQGDSNNFFRTAPAASFTGKVSIAVFGDCGRNDNSYQTATLASYQSYVGSAPAPIMLLLGDNAYNAGTDAEYTSNFFNVYSGNILKNHILFPAPGNHDYANTAARQTDHNVPYYSIFTMPVTGECGGIPSGTEAFYSYNWGNIHFLSLDSYGYEAGSTRLYDTLGPQVTWIKNDLAANTKKWTIAYWHHPPYTMGSHNSDTETELINMRQNFIRILERYGVDLILCGHSHDYERSYLLKGYYGNEASFSLGTHAVSGSSGKYDGTTNSCPYNTVSGPVNHGTVYVVSGSAGASGTVQAGYPHNALPFAQNDGGMLYLEVEDNRLDAKFIRKDGNIADKFTIMKDVSRSTNYSVTTGQSVTLTASWIGNYNWSTGATTRSITVSPSVNTSYSCNDGSTACLTDNFSVSVTTARSPMVSEQSLTAYPIPIERGNTLFIRTGTWIPLEIALVDEKGVILKKLTASQSGRIETADLTAGIYFIRTLSGDKPFMKKIIVK
jgi:hypothetical protein